VKQKKIHLAEELFKHAQELSAGNDDRLLNYCSGEGGAMKQNLQRSIDTFWTPDPAASILEPSSLDAAHLKAMCPRRILEMQRRARRQAPAAASIEGQVLVKTTRGFKRMRDIEIGKKQPRKSSSKDQVLLFDHFGRQAEVVFRPRCGLWRLRDFFEVLTACRQNSTLSGAEPSSAPEGGVRIPRQEVGWRAMVDSGVAKSAKQFSELTVGETSSAAAELRFGIGCGSLQWHPGAKVDEWIEAMPKDPAFESDSLANTTAEEKLVRLWAKGHVEDRHWLAFLRVLEECQHVVQQTKGFRVDKGVLCVTSSKGRATCHKSASAVSFGLLSAQASDAEAKVNASRQQKGLPSRMLMLGNNNSGAHRPQMPRSFYDKPAAAIKDA